jgi:hypothetical protein
LKDRILPGIDWNIAGQLKILNGFLFSRELAEIPQKETTSLNFYMDNGSFGPGDAEYWYQFIRLVKPNRIFEVGSGNSTLMAIKAISKNHQCDPSYICKHVCIEPYEMPWLEQISVSVVRKKIEEIDLSYFSELVENDILFIDSSHIIRPSGDVVFEFLELLPTLNKGVIVHVHDIFTPNNYPKQWLEDLILFWNEQYLLEAFLTNNSEWQIIGAVNYLYHNHYDKLQSIAQSLTPGSVGPGSFYIKKIA